MSSGISGSGRNSGRSSGHSNGGDGEVLQIKDLRVYYHTQRGPVKAVDGVDFSLGANMRMGLVGESGSGKSTMALALMRMIQEPGQIESGEILLDGVDLAKLSGEQMRDVRLRQISMIPQGAMNSLNPVVRIRKQIVDGIRAHQPSTSKRELERRVDEVLEWVDLDGGVAKMYPHELSGGMKQRVCIAIAISLRPRVIIADEPTSALDVVIQRQVMETIGRIQEELGAAVILIGHDMGLMVQFVDRLAVMYGGKIAELGDVRAMFGKPYHPYTQLLIKSLPKLDTQGELKSIPGVAPSLLNAPPGCIFHPRCPEAMDICVHTTPVVREMSPERVVACHLYNDVVNAASATEVIMENAATARVVPESGSGREEGAA